MTPGLRLRLTILRVLRGSRDHSSMIMSLAVVVVIANRLLALLVPWRAFQPPSSLNIHDIFGYVIELSCVFLPSFGRGQK